MFGKITKTFREIREVKWLAYHDAMTGLLNRNWLIKNMGSIRTNYVFFIDINNLHEINKTGHVNGDNHILNCIKIINKNLTQNDIFVRFAGDEFLVFSNNPFAISFFCPLFAVGKAEIDPTNIERAIRNANEAMILNK